jgi:hypothetical protein
LVGWVILFPVLVLRLVDTENVIWDLWFS